MADNPDIPEESQPPGNSSRQKNSLLPEGKIEELKEALIAEIKKEDDLRAEILKSLKIKSSWRTFFQHPAILLIIGFFLTSVVGAIFTSIWQVLDENKQNAQLIKQNKIKNKTATLNEISKLTLQTYSASRDTLGLYSRDELPEIRENIILERVQHWQNTTREWEEKSPVLQIQLEQQFTTTSVHSSFAEINNLRWKLGNEISNRRSEIKKNSWSIIDKECIGDECLAKECDAPDKASQHFKRKIRCNLELNEQMKKISLSMIEEMMKEINNNENDKSN